MQTARGHLSHASQRSFTTALATPGEDDEGTCFADGKSNHDDRRLARKDSRRRLHAEAVHPGAHPVQVSRATSAFPITKDRRPPGDPGGCRNRMDQEKGQFLLLSQGGGRKQGCFGSLRSIQGNEKTTHDPSPLTDAPRERL